MADARVIPIGEPGGSEGTARAARPRRTPARPAAGRARPAAARVARAQPAPPPTAQPSPPPPPPAPPPTAPPPPRSEPAAEGTPGSAGPRLPGDWDRRVAAGLAFLRRRLTGDYEVDELGFDRELTEQVLAPAVRPVYQHWFRVSVQGLGNLPDQGGALVVANHAGAVAWDAAMTQLAVLDHHPAHRHLRMLGADLVFGTPVVGALARKSGTTLACHADAERLLAQGELVGVWPEGFKGIGKPFAERYRLQRFGRGGFVAAALRTGVPIVPCSIVGSEEIYPMLANLGLLARLLGLPYVPVTPTFPWLGPLGLVPLPSKWHIEFGEAIPTADLGPAAAEDPMVVFDLTDRVRERIQHTLYSLLLQRRSVFF